MTNNFPDEIWIDDAGGKMKWVLLGMVYGVAVELGKWCINQIDKLISRSVARRKV
jgi:hypothetical protein